MIMRVVDVLERGDVHLPFEVRPLWIWIDKDLPLYGIRAHRAPMVKKRLVRAEYVRIDESASDAKSSKDPPRITRGEAPAVLAQLSHGFE